MAVQRLYLPLIAVVLLLYYLLRAEVLRYFPPKLGGRGAWGVRVVLVGH